MDWNAVQAMDPLAVSVFPFFAPPQGIQQVIVDLISKAVASVQVQAYSFTAAAVAKALVAAHERGVVVEVILDPSNEHEPSSMLSVLEPAGVFTLVDDQHAIAHDKVIIVDTRFVLTGSYNFTNAAEHKNAENVALIVGYDQAMEYSANFDEHRRHSRALRTPTQQERLDHRRSSEWDDPHA